MSIIEQIMQILAPHRCLGCGSEGSLLCTTCADGLPRPQAGCFGCGVITPEPGKCAACRQGSALAAVIAATSYDGLAKELVHYLKFERAAAAADTIANMLAPRIPWAAFDLVTFVPTAPVRVRMRGYDQAARVARALARAGGLPCVTLLARTGNQRQVGQGRATRHAQIQTAFYVRRSAALRGKRVLLVDDVFTTGASCESAACLLIRDGAAQVSAAVFAVARRSGQANKSLPQNGRL